MLMEMSQTKHYRKDAFASVRGLTLIEVLIALAIIAIAMTAVIKATSQNIRGTSYLQDKTMAMWVGQQVMNEARVGLRKLPDSSDKLHDVTNMLGRDWYWQASQEETPNKRIRKISVNVYTHEADDEESAPIVSLESYVYVPNAE